MAATMFAMDRAGGLYSLGLISLALGLSLSLTLAASSAFIADASSAETRGTAMGLLGSIMDIGHSSLRSTRCGHDYRRLWQYRRFLLFGSGHPWRRYRLCSQWAGEPALIF